MSEKVKKSKPKHCGKTMNALYIRKGTEKRKWIVVGYYCERCNMMVKEEDSIQVKRLQEILDQPDRLVSMGEIKKPTGIVLDIGETITKVGVSKESHPRFICDTAIYFDKAGVAFLQKHNLIEKIRELDRKITIFSREPKIDFEINLGNFEIFMNLIFEELNLDSTKTDVLVVERPYGLFYSDDLKGREDYIKNTSLPEEVKNNLLKGKMVDRLDGLHVPYVIRKQIAQVLFDRLNIPRIYFTIGEIVALYSTGSITGVVVNIGSRMTRIAPIYEGFIITHSISTRQKGGMDVVDEMLEYIENQEIEINGSPTKKEYILKNTRILSEELCYVTINIEAEEKLWLESDRFSRSMNVVSNTYVKLNEIRYQAPEILFEKEMLSVSMRKGDLIDAVIESVAKCDKELYWPLLRNVVLIGGGTMYKGFVERFTKDIKKHQAEGQCINVSAPSERVISSWIGGSILSTLKIFKENNLWVTRKEYDELGSKAVERCI